MGYVVYDVETTGLRKGFDQILQFAAVLTDDALEVRDRFELRCRLQPHIAPSPGALHITGADIRDITRPELPCHYEMACEIHRRLRAWGPAIYLGFNSLRFDEEFLRQAFYQSLLPVYVTNTGGSARGDALSLARVVASLRPHVFQAHRDDDGRPVFRLAELARANGIAAPNAHTAMADVEITLALCRRLHTAAPDLWSRFVQFSQKSVAANFIRDEPAFLMFQAFGDQCRQRVLARIGEHAEQTNRQYCLDLTVNLDELESQDDDALAARFSARDGPLVIVRTNAAPLLCPLYDLVEGAQDDGRFSGAEACAAELEDRPGFRARLEAAARRAEPAYPEPLHVEQQLYGFPFPTPQDEVLMRDFHAAGWEDRLVIAGRFNDARYRQLGRRIVFFQRPDLFEDEAAARLAAALRRRLNEAAADAPWLTAPAARAELAELLNTSCESDPRERLFAYEAYLAALSDLAPV